MSLSCEGKNPPSFNILTASGFKFQLDRIAGVSYFITKANVPGISATAATIPTPFKTLPFTHDKVTYEDFVITFKVDENLSNYLNLHNWLKNIGFPNSYEESKAEYKVSPYSDGSLIIMTPSYVPNLQVKFKNMFPVSLSSIDLAVDLTDVEYISATAAFKYQIFDIGLVT